MRIFIIISLCCVSTLFGKEHPRTPKRESVHARGAAAAQSSYDTLAYSMVLWGVGMGATAAILASFLQGSTSDSGSNSHSHSH